MSDGGNVRVSGIEGPVAEVEGACGSASSAMTMKMGGTAPQGSHSRDLRGRPGPARRAFAASLASSARRRASTPSRGERPKRSMASMACRASTPSTRNTTQAPDITERPSTSLMACGRSWSRAAPSIW